MSVTCLQPHLALPINNSTDAALLSLRAGNETDRLFYRDDSFVHSRVYWARGNGWAFSALVAAIEHTPPGGPHRAEYIAIFKQHAAEILKTMDADGAGSWWHASLICGDCLEYPWPETTGSASFAYGMAWGINNGLLPAATYLPAVHTAWKWLEGTALHADGRVGNCQPGGGAPENNFNETSTSQFCVGLFLLATSQVSIAFK
eukprot:SAG22_NODE_512_length_9579_cov_27.293143_2_plen_203_part_00